MQQHAEEKLGPTRFNHWTLLYLIPIDALPNRAEKDDLTIFVDIKLTVTEETRLQQFSSRQSCCDENGRTLKREKCKLVNFEINLTAELNGKIIQATNSLKFFF